MLSIAQYLRSNFIAQLYLLEEAYNCVLWVRNHDYSQQLFVGPNYEKYWGRSCLSLYKNPDIWQTYLVDEESSVTNEQLKQRNTPTNPKHTEFVCFRHADGNTRWMQDRSFRITHRDGNCIIVAGIAYPITIADMEGDAQAKVSDIIDEAVVKFSTILTSKYDESGQYNKSAVLQNNQLKLLKSLSTREIEVLYQLLQGNSMVVIAKLLKLSPRTIETYINILKHI